MQAHTGDRIVVETTTLGAARRCGEVLEVLGTDEGEHYRVRWEDGRETVFYPSSDATIHPGKKHRPRASGRAAASP
jgi:hypothetical protein